MPESPARWHDGLLKSYLQAWIIMPLIVVGFPFIVGVCP